jgi:hypothetical protein
MTVIAVVAPAHDRCHVTDVAFGVRMAVRAQCGITTAEDVHLLLPVEPEETKIS